MRKAVVAVKNFIDDMALNNLKAHAAACAFYTFLSLVPFVALAASVLPYTGLTQDELTALISDYIPSALSSLIASVVDDIYFAPGAVLPLSILLTIWMASRAFSALIRGVEDVCGAKRYAPFLKRSLLACIYTLALLALMIIVPVILAFGQDIVSALCGGEPEITPFLRGLLNLRFLLVLMLMTLVFMLIYHWVPGMHLKFRALFPGALAASAAWLLFTWLFSLFIRYGGGYSTYGSLAAIVICLLWMYWCMYIILLGAQLNVFISGNPGARNC